jgi:hypothetical protein
MIFGPPATAIRKKCFPPARTNAYRHTIVCPSGDRYSSSFVETPASVAGQLAPGQFLHLMTWEPKEHCLLVRLDHRRRRNEQHVQAKPAALSGNATV